jgi:DNA gyrase/topoisomerase IV subunit B
MQVSNNAEITALKQIIGLQHNKTYADTKNLRYGKVMIMTDQDQDGSHIKGLIMNYLHHFYPSLLQVPGFLVEFITPIVKVCYAPPHSIGSSFDDTNEHEIEIIYRVYPSCGC